MIYLLAALALAGPESEPVHVQIDWQGHPAMHIPWPMFGRGLTDRSLKRRTWRHMFRQTVSEPTLSESGVRLVLAAAMAAERARNPKQARRLILKQLHYVEDFVEAHADDYALARTPSEVRTLLHTTDKIVFVHSIEGGHHLLWEEGDARFWADQGVALVTLIHLRDKEFGGAALVDEWLRGAINPLGARRRRRGEDRGLSELGRERIVDLWNAGILVDYTHMSPDAMVDALEVSATHGVPPVLTHGKLDQVHDDEFAISEDQLVEVYRLGGFLGLGLSAEEVGLDDPPAGAPDDICWGTLEAFAYHYDQVNQVLAAHADELVGPFEDSATQLAVGWSSDWNGWLSHSRPVYGRKGCRDPAERDDLRPIDTIGLAHPGVLPDHWTRVEERGVSIEPMLHSSERFLRLWDQARASTD